MTTPPLPDPDERLTRLEEAQGFADHRADQLAEQVEALSRKVEEFGRRLAVFEARALHDQSVRDHLAGREPPNQAEG
jgi:hypothetical protein